jgi:hypothetical protein
MRCNPYSDVFKYIDGEYLYTSSAGRAAMDPLLVSGPILLLGLISIALWLYRRGQEAKGANLFLLLGLILILASIAVLTLIQTFSEVFVP